MDSIIRFAIISDLHCSHSTSENSSTETGLLTDNLRLPFQEHPVQSFIELIEENNISADYLVCPGDITNRIDKQGLISGYGFLQEIKEKLKAKELFLSVGNHDVDSFRIYKEFDNAYHVLRHFTKIYPYNNIDNSSSQSLNSKYWSEGYYIFINDEILVLNINTCFEHFNIKDAKAIKILKETLNKIEKEIKQLNFKGMKIAVFHHHPVKISNSNIRYKDFDSIDNGNILLQLLEDLSFSLVIHGHKHIPVIQLRNSLPIFCSGSFSSFLNIREINGFNTFHILEIDSADNYKKGIIKSYFYSPQQGWFILKDPYYFFPHITGYGNNIEIEELKENLKNLIQQENYLEFSKVVELIPNIRFLLPSQQEKLEELLEIEKLTFNPKLALGPKYLENYGNR